MDVRMAHIEEWHQTLSTRYFFQLPPHCCGGSRRFQTWARSRAASPPLGHNRHEKAIAPRPTAMLQKPESEPSAVASSLQRSAHKGRGPKATRLRAACCMRSAGNTATLAMAENHKKKNRRYANKPDNPSVKTLRSRDLSTYLNGRSPTDRDRL